jgi:hypothetical protein
MSATTAVNGQHKLLWWLIGAVLGPLLLAAFGNLLSTTYTTSERASGLEAESRALHQRLERIERKLDQLLERR